MIDVSGLSKSFGSTTVLHDLSLTIGSSRLTSIIGRNGAGKSTLLSIVARLEKADAGTVHVDGLDVHTAKTDAVARKVAVLRQQYEFTARVTVRDVVGFGRYPHSRNRLTSVDREHIESAIEFFDLGTISRRFIDELSGGQRQRALAAMVLAQDTDVVLLDEPLNNLDMEHSVRMMLRLRDLVDDLGKTVVTVLHDINFAAAYSDNIVLLDDGRIALNDTPAALMDSATLRDAFGISADVISHRARNYALYYRPNDQPDHERKRA